MFPFFQSTYKLLYILRHRNPSPSGSFLTDASRRAPTDEQWLFWLGSSPSSSSLRPLGLLCPVRASTAPPTSSTSELAPAPNGVGQRHLHRLPPPLLLLPGNPRFPAPLSRVVPLPRCAVSLIGAVGCNEQGRLRRSKNGRSSRLVVRADAKEIAYDQKSSLRRPRRPSRPDTPPPR